MNHEEEVVYVNKRFGPDVLCNLGVREMLTESCVRADSLKKQVRRERKTKKK